MLPGASLLSLCCHGDVDKHGDVYDGRAKQCHEKKQQRNQSAASECFKLMSFIKPHVVAITQSTAGTHDKQWNTQKITFYNASCNRYIEPTFDCRARCVDKVIQELQDSSLNCDLC
jgi:hypothetical protein